MSNAYRIGADQVLFKEVPGAVAVPNLLKVLCGIFACSSRDYWRGSMQHAVANGSPGSPADVRIIS
jgi:hypothetical protein